MRSLPWLGKLWKRVGTGLVQDVPSSLEECEACREVECTQERWETCERRLATEATNRRLKAAQTPESPPREAAEVSPAPVEVPGSPKTAS
jgi:hypothetical protein